MFMGRLAMVISDKSVIHPRLLSIQLKLDYFCCDKEGGGHFPPSFASTILIN